MANFQIERFKRLPQRTGDTWQGGIHRMDAWVKGEDEQPHRPEVILWGSLTTGRVGASAPEDPSKKSDIPAMVDALAKFAFDEENGYRPGKIEVKSPALAEHLSEILAGSATRVEYCPKLTLLDRCAEEIQERSSDDDLPPQGYLNGKGVTLDRVRSFAEAARLFHQAAPWKHLCNEDLIEIESPQTEREFRYALVLGRFDDHYGLSFYRSMEHFWRVCENENPAQLLQDGHNYWIFSFNDITEIPFLDVDLWEDHDLPLADEEAYPFVLRYNDKTGFSRPSADHLAFFEGLMRVLAVTTETEMDSGRWTHTAQTAEGPKEFVLSLPFLLNPPGHEELHGHGILDRRATEAVHAQIARFMEGKNFNSIEEANEGLGKELSGKPLDPKKYKPRDPMEEAQELCYQAFDSLGRKKILLAREAIAKCPDCADAYVILAEAVFSPQEAEELYTNGVAAGRRALGENVFIEDVGHFWGLNQTRPYMRTLAGLADVQLVLGRPDEAIANYQELLRLNPNDNQGIRDKLLPLLIARGQTGQAEALLAAYPGDILASWSYCRALVTFQKEGDSEEARSQIQEAIKANRHLRVLLLDPDKIGEVPTEFRFGSLDEAKTCANGVLPAWEAVPGSLDWLKKQGPKSASKKTRTVKKVRRPPPKKR